MRKFGLTQKKIGKDKKFFFEISEKLRFLKKTMEMHTNHYNKRCKSRRLQISGRSKNTEGTYVVGGREQ